MTYREKLMDPRWQKLSAMVKERAEWKCERCGRADKQLHAHHLAYERGAEPWDYAPNALECLCYECHSELEALLTKLRWSVCDMQNSEIRRLIKLVLKRNWKRVPLTKARLEELTQLYNL